MAGSVGIHVREPACQKVVMKRVIFHNNTCNWESDLAQTNDLQHMNFSDNVYRQHENGNGKGMFHFPQGSETTISFLSAENNRVSNLLTVNNGDLMISRAVLRRNSFFYGLLSASESNVTLNESLFASNICHGIGSPVHLSNASPAHFSSCSFLNNTAVEMGGGIRALNSSSLTFSSCYFDKNHVKGERGVGGAIAIVGSLNSIVDNLLFLESKSCTFSSNTATLGGALSLSQWKGNLVWENCSFIENKNIVPKSVHVRPRGGAVDIADSDIKNFVMNDSYFLSNTGLIHGGGISLHNVGGSLLFDKCGFRNNVIDTYGRNPISLGGSGISVFSIDHRRPTSVIFRESYFGDNKSGSGPGAVCANGSQVSLEIENCSFFRNEGDSGGSVSASNVYRLLVKSSDFERNVAYKNGGAVDCRARKIDLEKNTFFHNRAGKKGGSVFLSNIENGTRVEKCEFIGCSSSMGGGIHVDSSAGFILNANKFYHNNATVGGGGLSVLLLDGSTNSRIENCYFAMHHAPFGGKTGNSDTL